MKEPLLSAWKHQTAAEIWSLESKNFICMLDCEQVCSTWMFILVRYKWLIKQMITNAWWNTDEEQRSLLIRKWKMVEKVCDYEEFLTGYKTLNWILMPRCDQQNK